MTMNVYLGADLFRFFQLYTDPNDPCNLFHGNQTSAALPCAVSEVWSEFLFTDFPSRAAVLADHIERAKPDVLGLQEVLTAYTGPFNSSVSPANPGANVLFQDYLKILQDELRNRSLAFDVAGECVTGDLELPAYNDPFNSSSGGFNARFNAKNVLLVNADTSDWANNASLVFEANPQILVPASYCAVMADVSVREVSYRVTSAHLATSGTAKIQSDQAKELVENLSSATLPQIIVGDINSDLSYDEIFPTAYEVLTQAGHEDIWLRNQNPNASEDGWTFGHNGTLTNEEANFSLRLDYVLYNSNGSSGAEKIAWMDIFGDDPEDSRTADGKLWGSDHAAVFADLAAPPTGDGTSPPTISSSPTVAPTISKGRAAYFLGASIRCVVGFVSVVMGLSAL